MFSYKFLEVSNFFFYHFNIIFNVINITGNKLQLLIQ